MSASHCKMETVFDYSWLNVMQAFWQRYPNPTSTHVLTEDTIKREVRAGKLYSRRLLSKTNAVPKWGERFYRNTPVMIMEDSVLDLKNKTLTTFTRNIGLQKIMKVTEIVYYTSHNDEGRSTKAVRLASVTSHVSGLSRAICAYGIKRFKSNCQKAACGFNCVLQRMFPRAATQQQQLSPPPSRRRIPFCINYAVAQQKLFWLRAMIRSHRLSQAHWRYLNHRPASHSAILNSSRIRQLIWRKWENRAMFKAIRERLRCHSPYRKWLMSHETLANSRSMAYLQFFQNLSYSHFCKK